jgi:hypothetical protein
MKNIYHVVPAAGRHDAVFVFIESSEDESVLRAVGLGVEPDDGRDGLLLIRAFPEFFSARLHIHVIA